MRIDEETINDIRKSVNIVDIISDYIPVEQKGRNYFSICPFHDDHNPSMSISPDKQIYTCFVCGAHGNVFNFIMDYENVSFVKALKVVADKVGIHIDVNDNTEKQISPSISAMYDIYDIAFKYYENNLKTKDGTTAMKYLTNRGFTDDIIKEFGVGLSTRNKLTKMLQSKKYSDELLLKSGISVSNSNGLYDMFTDRIMFPLWDLEGRVVGFSGRIYDTEDSSKYVNSKESDIFKKGNLLYNYHRAKDFARKKKSIIIVEGFMDVIALYKVGILNVVATMGTAITHDVAKLIKKLSTNVILCFDGDKAGEKATLSCIKELDDVGLTPKIVRLPENLDPDEFIIKYGKEKIYEYFDNPKSLLEYKINNLKQDTNFSSSEDVALYAKKVVEEISKIDDKLVLELEINKLSNETNISTSTIKGMLKKDVVVKKDSDNKKQVLNKYDKAERRLIYYMIRNKEVINIYENNKCYFKTQEFRYLVSELTNYYDRHGEFCIADFISYLSDKKELLDAFNLIDTLNLPDEYSYDEIIDYIDLLNKYSYEEQIKKLTREFKSETDSIRKMEILKRITELKESE